MAWQQQGYNQNHGGGQGYGQSNQYGQQQQFNQHQQYAAQVLYGGQSQGYNQGNNWSAGPSNMNKGPGHFGNSHRVRFTLIFHNNKYLFKESKLRIRGAKVQWSGTGVGTQHQNLKLS